jgi:hypothetical protein
MIPDRGCTRVVVVAVVLVLAPAVGLADQYWVAYEANDFPENMGWLRRYGDENGPMHGGAERSVAEGILTLDGLRHDQIYDGAEMQRPIDPGPGELFVAA